MIIYITLAYGLIVTGVNLLLRREVARARSQRDTWREVYDKALSDLDAIYYTRHLAAKKARAAQIAQRKAQVLAKAAELQVDRIAA